MQDNYVGDIGDYGKYGLLRTLTDTGLTLAVNWYRVIPKTVSAIQEPANVPIRRKQDDGKYTDYLNRPDEYRQYDPELFDCLEKLVKGNRCLEALQASGILQAQFFLDELTVKDRLPWHNKALNQTASADVVFLDPDNGLETETMHCRGTATEKHVTWQEAKTYYDRGQSVILYQHRPQMMKKEVCIHRVMYFQQSFLRADHTLLLEYPRFTNRYYFLFFHQKHRELLETVYRNVAQNWKGLCSPVELCRLPGDH